MKRIRTRYVQCLQVHHLFCWCNLKKVGAQTFYNCFLWNENEKLLSERLERRERKIEAAIKIQRFYLRYRIKQQVRLRHLKRMQHIGMTDERRWDFHEQDETRAVRERTRNKKGAFDEAFRKACEDTKARIVRVRGPWIMEDITDHIRNWFHEMYEAGDELDKYPPAKKGGTIMVIRGETMSPLEFAEYVKQQAILATKSPEDIKKMKDEAKKKRKAERDRIKMEKAMIAKEKEARRLQMEKSGIKQWEFDDKFISKEYG